MHRKATNGKFTVFIQAMASGKVTSAPLRITVLKLIVVARLNPLLIYFYDSPSAQFQPFCSCVIFLPDVCQWLIKTTFTLIRICFFAVNAY